MTEYKRVPKISANIRTLITIEALRYPRTPRKALALDLQERIRNMGEPAPTEETLMRMVSDARTNEPQEPGYWHLGANTVPPIPAEAVPHIFEVQRLMMGRMKTDELPVNLAIWIGRLYKMISDPDKLFMVSLAYAFTEFIAIVSKLPPDTRELDRLLRDGKIGALTQIASDLNDIIMNRPKNDWQTAIASELKGKIELFKKEGEQ